MISKDLLQHKDAWRNEEIYKEIYEFSIKNPEAYWEAQLDRLSWTKLPSIITKKVNQTETLWFPDGKINACYNCVDRHAEKNPNKTAVIWQSEDIDVYQKVSYKKLQDEVCKFANTLKKLGLTRRDYVTVYMPMVPEGVYACLACARLGIPYSAVFAGFSPNAVALRMNDCNSNFIISCDANMRGGKTIPLKANVDAARKICNREIRSLIVRRQNLDIRWDDSSDNDYYELSKNASMHCEIADTDSLSELFILYTSGSAGKPKGVVMGTGGFLLFSGLTGKYFFNLEEDAVFWCTGDIGWMGGHAYSLYSALCNGVTSVFFEGIPTYPRKSIFFEVIDKHSITSLNTAPTAIRAMMKHPKESLGNTSRDSLKYLGVFGEVLNKDAWFWYFNEVGKKRCPIVNMWGQTELGGVPTAPLSNLEDMKKYGHIGRQFFGCELVLRDENDETITVPETKGAMFIKHPLPGMLIRVFGDEHAMQKIYYSQTKDSLYFTGDEAYFDHDGNYWITGRCDDVLNVSGHRTSPIEIEEVIAGAEGVAEVSVVGYPHPIKGEGIYAFVVLKKDISADKKENARQIIAEQVRTMISPITKPDIITIVNDLPKTRSGKIMRRILRKIAAKDYQNFEDLTTIANPECIEELIKNREEM
ncbi:MAG: acetate--CoA ligase [Holosporales bacterium]|jgi:acetyl-CoA synthetase|nr:acetate--CoA ligase [Holosporales bacterium]